MNADGGRKKQRAEGRKHIAVVKVTKSRKTGRGYTTSRNAIKASIRYISHRPNQEGERQTRTLFGRDGEDVSKWQAYDFVNSMRPGTKFVRIIISPDAKREDSNRALHMRRVTLRTIAALERRLGRDVQFIACVHDDHTENRHVHVIATVSRRLGVSDFREMREAATAACRTQGREWEQKRSRSRSRHLNRGKTAGFTHEVPEAEHYACFSNCKSSSALSGVAISKPRRVVAERAQLPERPHALPLVGSCVNPGEDGRTRDKRHRHGYPAGSG